MVGGPITSVVPTTTATALTSIALGVDPAAHGVVGYRVRVAGPSGAEVLNVLRWRTSSGDARPFVPPTEFQPTPAFGGRSIPVVTRSEFLSTGFTAAHLGGGRHIGWMLPSALVVEVAAAGGVRRAVRLRLLRRDRQDRPRPRVRRLLRRRVVAPPIGWSVTSSPASRRGRSWW